MMTVFEQHTQELVQSACRKIPDVTLRDLFAMSAINGMSANSGMNNYTIEDLAEAAYRQADAMLEARKK